MTQEQKLQKIIERAVEKGYNLGQWFFSQYGDLRHPDIEGGYIPLLDHAYYEIIFSHSFLKAYFKGEGITFRPEPNNPNTEMCAFDWKYHAQQLAITPEEERIDHLYKFIENDRANSQKTE